MFRWKNIFVRIRIKKLTQNSLSSNENYKYISYEFAHVVNKHAPLKTIVLRAIMHFSLKKHLRKEIYWRSALTNKLYRKASKLNWEKYKKQQNKCVKLRKRSIKTYIENITKSGVISNKNFFFLEFFIMNKGILMDNEISLMHNGKTKDDEKQITEIITSILIF